MSSDKTNVSRRAILKGLAALPVVTMMGYTSVAHAELLSPDDATAKALGYVKVSSTDGQSCANCNLYQGGDAAQGGCPIFPGKEVLATGWCKSWVKKM